MIIGHDSILHTLKQTLPKVSLIVGPAHVGKWTLALEVLRHHNVSELDCCVFTSLSTEAIHSAQQFMAHEPFSIYRVMMARLDGASDIAIQALLRMVEEPATSARFVFVAEKPPVATLISRSHVFRCGFLTQQQVEEVCRQWGMSKLAAQETAQMTRGTLLAEQEIRQYQEALDVVHQLLQAISQRNQEVFHEACGRVTEEARSLFFSWMIEAITGRWKIFSPFTSYGLHWQKQGVRRMVLALSMVSGARPKLAIQTALGPFVRGTV